MTSPVAATILIVDDEVQNRKLIELMLRPEGYLTAVASSGEDALALIAEQQPDLVLLDIMLPGIDGYQVARSLKGNPATANIPIIMVTALMDRDARLKGLNAGAEEFLTKPVERAELWLRVRNLLRLKAYGDMLRNQSAVLEHQVLARTESLGASESRFRQLAENIRDVFFLQDVKSDQMLYISPAYEEIWGRSCASLIENPASWADAIHPQDRNQADVDYRNGKESGNYRLAYRIVRPDGQIRFIDLRVFPVHDDLGHLIRVAGVAEDITGRRKEQDRIAYLNRVYAVLSGINTLIVRVHNRAELFHEACRIAVETGGLRMSWIGIVDPALMQIDLVASCGVDDGLMTVLKDGLSAGDGSALRDSMAAQAVRERQVIVRNDLRSGPAFGHGMKHAEAGMLSMAIFPLIVAGEVVGVFALCAAEVEFFQVEELALLTELAGDIAFAIDHIAKQDRLEYLAFHDLLTGLANRTLYLERVTQQMRLADAGGHRLALFAIDLERFKSINETLGRPAGDALLLQVAQWLSQNSGDSDLVARLDADHFALLLPLVRPTGDLTRLVEAAHKAFLAHPFRLNDTVFRVTARIGAAQYPDDGGDAETLLKNAEAALKKAKASGEPYLFYTQAMGVTAAGRLAMENRLRHALDRGEFVLHYQPKISLATGQLTSAEALLRWNDPNTGLMPPGRFIPILEETGLIQEVGRWALRQALADYLRWLALGLPAVRIAVNLSSLQLRHRGFAGEIGQIVASNPQAAAALELEITESLLMEDVDLSIGTLQAIRAMGLTIAIDDFGTGFSSLSYLSKLPVDTLKIDRSFISDMTRGPQGLSLVSTIVNLAHSLKLEVVAEGVETEEQQRLLRLLGCDEMQGYLFSKPVPAEVFEARFLARPEAVVKVVYAGA